MIKNKSRVLVLSIVCAAFFLLACETANLIGGTAPTPIREAPIFDDEQAPEETPTRDPEAPYDFVPADTPRCSAGDNSISIVNGQITLDGAPIAGQQIQVGSAPGGDLLNETPTESDDSGNFQIPFVCDGSACNGSYWLWVVNGNNEQLSPFVQFNFDDQCRRGTVNFSNP